MPPQSYTTIVLRGFSWPAAAGIAVAGVVVLWLTWRGVRRGGKRSWSAALLVLRAVALLGVAFAILQPEIVRRSVELLRNRVLVLCDGSLSMDLPSGAGDLSRQQVVRERLGGPEGPLADLAERFEVTFVEFGDVVREATGEALSRERSGGMVRTDLRAALRALREQHLDEAVQAVLLVTDGADTELPEPQAERRAALRDELASLARPVTVFCTADPSGIRDVGITALRCPQIAFVRRRWEAEVEVSVVGLDAGTLTVLLRSGESIVDFRRVTIEEATRRFTVRLGFTPIKPERMPLSIEVQPHADETYHANNYAGLVLSVARDKIRVLHVAGRPSWDVRFLRRMLKQTPTVDLVAFFILRDVTDRLLGETPNSYVNLIPFPTEELFTRELRTFDVVIFQNFDYRPFELYPQSTLVYLRNISKHVIEDGGAFVMVGGDQSFDRGRYAGTPIENVLPLELPARGGLVDERRFRARLTAAGRKHPITRIESDEAENAELWGKMPELAGCHVLPTVKEGATALLEHPTLRAGAGALPLVVIGEAGKGRTIAVTKDETWKWNFLAAGEGLGNRLYLRFWQNALRWLAHELEDPRIVLSMASRAVRPDEKVTGVVRVLDKQYAPRAGAKVTLSVTPAERRGRPGETMQLTSDEQGRAPFEFAQQDAGTYRIAASASEGEGAALATSTFVRVEVPGRELKDLRPDEELLRWTASESGGQFFNIARDEPPGRLPIKPKRVERLLRREVRPLWNNWITYALVVGLLCAEWWQRRKRGVT